MCLSVCTSRTRTLLRPGKARGGQQQEKREVGAPECALDLGEGPAPPLSLSPQPTGLPSTASLYFKELNSVLVRKNSLL